MYTKKLIMMKKTFFIFVSFIIIVIPVISQENGSTKITIFKPEDNKPTRADIPRQQDLHCLKWNYFALIRGVFLINYEFQLKKKLSAEIGLGLTYRDLIFEATHDSYFNISSYKAKYNFCIEGGVRFYPKDFDSFEGIYFSPMFSYRRYTLTTATDLYSSYQFTNTIFSFKPGYNLVDLQLRFGYQYESFWYLDLLGDFYVGAGMRNATVNYYAGVHNATTGGTDYVSTKKQLQFPQLLCGFKICVPF